MQDTAQCLLLRCSAYVKRILISAGSAFVISDNSVIRLLIKSGKAQLQHSIMKSDTLAEKGLHADKQHYCCYKR